MGIENNLADWIKKASAAFVEKVVENLPASDSRRRGTRTNFRAEIIFAKWQRTNVGFLMDYGAWWGVHGGSIQESFNRAAEHKKQTLWPHGRGAASWKPVSTNFPLHQN